MPNKSCRSKVASELPLLPDAQRASSTGAINLTSPTLLVLPGFSQVIFLQHFCDSGADSRLGTVSRQRPNCKTQSYRTGEPFEGEHQGRLSLRGSGTTWPGAGLPFLWPLWQQDRAADPQRSRWLTKHQQVSESARNRSHCRHFCWVAAVTRPEEAKGAGTKDRHVGRGH